MTPEDIWEKYSQDADWEIGDRVDDYCVECNVGLVVDGHIFSGYGTICCGEREIESLECECPDGRVVKIY